ncbi:hypothetical protein [Halovivax gelatinilyticus]|uniref:hypothetical protein n=1 Tax=Halovivax gelatinilyticus TaxID=2961597 RepID=UPI0020CA54EB|nr:hypothetical protein [Halovivax gelatinilyticus]
MDRTRRAVLAGGAAMMISVSGCLGGDDDDGEPVPDSIDASEFEVLDRDDESVTVYVHDDHWDHGPLVVPLDDIRSVGAYVEDEDGDEVELGEDIRLDATLVDGAQDIVSIESHGDHIHFQGDETGLTDVVIQLIHDEADGPLYETPVLSVEIADDHDHDDDHGHDHESVDTLRIFDRGPDPHEEVADVHGDHWHGELPHIHVGENISLGGEFEDDDGHTIPIGSDEEYELGVAVAEDAPEGIVSIDPDGDFHGDHVHVHGEQEGETELVFSLWHDDHADWESPPIAVEVEDH